MLQTVIRGSGCLSHSLSDPSFQEQYWLLITLPAVTISKSIYNHSGSNIPWNTQPVPDGLFWKIKYRARIVFFDRNRVSSLLCVKLLSMSSCSFLTLFVVWIDFRISLVSNKLVLIHKYQVSGCRIFLTCSQSDYYFCIWGPTTKSDKKTQHKIGFDDCYYRHPVDLTVLGANSSHSNDKPFAFKVTF